MDSTYQTSSLHSQSALQIAFLASQFKHSRLLKASGRTQLTCMRMTSSRSRMSVDEKKLLEARGHLPGEKKLFDGICNVDNQGVNMVLALHVDNPFKVKRVSGII